MLQPTMTTCLPKCSSSNYFSLWNLQMTVFDVKCYHGMRCQRFLNVGICIESPLVVCYPVHSLVGGDRNLEQLEAMQEHLIWENIQPGSCWIVVWKDYFQCRKLLGGSVGMEIKESYFFVSTGLSEVKEIGKGQSSYVFVLALGTGGKKIEKNICLEDVIGYYLGCLSQSS